MDQKLYRGLGAAGVLAISALVYFGALCPEKFGFYHDDGLYVVTAKALAEGEGYRIISLPSEPPQTKYPPVFPLLLSLIWRTSPGFPANLPILMMLSVFATLAFLSMTAAYLVARRYASWWPAWIVVLVAAFNWRTVALATSTLSEPVYAALSVAALWLADVGREKRPSVWRSLALGLSMGLLVLTRLAGVALLIAYLLDAAVRRRFGRAIFPGAIAGCVLLVWVLWCLSNGPAGQAASPAYYSDYLQDWREMSGLTGQSGAASAAGSVSAMILKNAFTLCVSLPAVALGASADWYARLGGFSLTIAIAAGFLALFFIGAGFLRLSSGRLRLLHGYVLSYLALHMLWPYSLFDRFLIPLLPFLLLFLWTEGEYIFGLLQKALHDRNALRVALLPAFLGVAIFGVISIIAHRSTLGLFGYVAASRRTYVQEARESKEVFDWIRQNTAPADVLSCYRDPIFYLFTGRKAVRPPAPSMTESAEKDAEILFKMIDEYSVRYLIQTPVDFDLEAEPDLRRRRFHQILESHADRFTPVFSLPGWKGTVYRVHPPASAHER